MENWEAYKIIDHRKQQLWCRINSFFGLLLFGYIYAICLPLISMAIGFSSYIELGLINKKAKHIFDCIRCKEWSK